MAFGLPWLTLEVKCSNQNEEIFDAKYELSRKCSDMLRRRPVACHGAFTHNDQLCACEQTHAIIHTH